jgi:hypothetical protein
VSSDWTCSVCGKRHQGLAFSWGFEAPAHWIEEFAERPSDRYFCNEDVCWLLDDAGAPARFVRGLIEIPTHEGTGDEATFSIGAWVSLSETNFTWLMEHWEADDREQGDLWFGWLSNSIPVYPETLNLKTNVRLQGPNLRPLITLEPTGHPLAVDQHRGVTLARAHELAHRWLHLAYT